MCNLLMYCDLLFEYSNTFYTYIQDKWTPLHFTSLEGHTEIVALLLSERGNANAKTSVSSLYII